MLWLLITKCINFRVDFVRFTSLWMLISLKIDSEFMAVGGRPAWAASDDSVDLMFNCERNHEVIDDLRDFDWFCSYVSSVRNASGASSRQFSKQAKKMKKIKTTRKMFRHFNIGNHYSLQAMMFWRSEENAPSKRLCNQMCERKLIPKLKFCVECVRCVAL